MDTNNPRFSDYCSLGVVQYNYIVGRQTKSLYRPTDACSRKLASSGLVSLQHRVVIIAKLNTVKSSAIHAIL
jgi:hypothetical protein